MHVVSFINIHLLFTASPIACLSFWQQTAASSSLLKIHDQIYDIYTKRLAASQTPAMAIQYVCIENGSCGGLGDRIKGAAMAFVLALFSDRIALPLQMQVPLDFGLFFEPGRPVPSFQQPHPSGTLNMIDSPDSWRSLTLTMPLVYVRANQFEQAYVNLLQNPIISDDVRSTYIHGLFGQLSPSEVLHCILPFVYGIPTPALSLALEEAWPPLPFDFKVGVHMRTGVTEWPDPQRMPLTFQPSWDSAISCLCRSHTLCLIILMSDNTKILQDFIIDSNVCKLHYCLHFDGPVLHIDRSPFNSVSSPALTFQTYKRGFVEFLALHFVDHIFAPMSQFSRIPSRRMLISMSIWNGTGFEDA